MSPDVGEMKPAIKLRMVVFPEPLGPRRVRNSPPLISRQTEFTALTGPKYLQRFTRLTVAPAFCFSVDAIAGHLPLQSFLQFLTSEPPWHGCIQLPSVPTHLTFLNKVENTAKISHISYPISSRWRLCYFFGLPVSRG